MNIEITEAEKQIILDRIVYLIVNYNSYYNRAEIELDILNGLANKLGHEIIKIPFNRKWHKLVLQERSAG